MSCTTSSVTLGAVTFDIDPLEYTPLLAVRRGSVHRMIDGTTVIQDRGAFLNDNEITLRGHFTQIATVQALENMYLTAGGQYTFTDFKGNEFLVCFCPGEASFVVSPIRGANNSWDYTMKLRVLSVVKLLGV
jgi:hypothetical protein